MCHWFPRSSNVCFDFLLKENANTSLFSSENHTTFRLKSNTSSWSPSLKSVCQNESDFFCCYINKVLFSRVILWDVSL